MNAAASWPAEPPPASEDMSFARRDPPKPTPRSRLKNDSIAGKEAPDRSEKPERERGCGGKMGSRRRKRTNMDDTKDTSPRATVTVSEIIFLEVL